MSGDLAAERISSKDANMESQILAAMRARVTYLRDGADSFTFESVRRLLEEDMGLEKFALDAHKSFVKEHIVKCLEDADNVGTSDNPQETARKDDASLIEQVTKPCEDNEAKKDVREENALAEDIENEKNKQVLLRDIRIALQRRTSYIRLNSEKITMGSLRRLLEQDLKLDKNDLDPFKKFINNELDEVLQISDAQNHSTESIGKNPKKKVKSTPSKKLSSEENSKSDAEGDVDDEEVAAKNTTTHKRKLSKSKMAEKPKRGNDELVPARKKAKHADIDSENDSNDVDNDHSQSSSEKPSKRTKETATAAYGKRVEHLKAIIKSCGMSIPPTIYRKAKQAPEEKREATLIKELEQILAKEGLSSDPSEKEIKEVRKRKDRTKELEGIDTSNIVSSSRRRSTTSFVPPPKPKITEESESEIEESEDGAENEDEEEEEEEEEEGNEEAEEGSHSEEESYNEDDGGEESE